MGLKIGIARQARTRRRAMLGRHEKIVPRLRNHRSVAERTGERDSSSTSTLLPVVHMSRARLTAYCAAALLLVAAPLAAQETATPASAAPQRDSAVTRPLPTADREKFVGDYDILLPNGWIMATLIYVEDGQLMIEPEGQPKMQLRFLGNDTFGLDFDSTLRLAFEVKDGKVVGGKLTQRGQRMNVFRRP